MLASVKEIIIPVLEVRKQIDRFHSWPNKFLKEARAKYSSSIKDPVTSILVKAVHGKAERAGEKIR